MRLNKNDLILVTGAAGRMGRTAVRALAAAGWQVRGFDRGESPNCAEFVAGDLASVSDVERAMKGAKALIHLAATPDDDLFLERLVPNNLIGLHHVLEAAHGQGVERLVLASSGQVNWWQQFDGPLPIRIHDPLTPKHWYAMTKVAAEAAGKSFARQFGMTVLAPRLGWLPRTREQVAEIAASDHFPKVYLSPGDAGRFFVSALEADVAPGFYPLYVTSLPKSDPVFDLEPVRQLINWQPRDSWPTAANEDLNG